MSRMIFCSKLKKQAEGLAMPPYPGDLGKRIFDNICQEAWQQWVGRQTMLLNEYQLNTLDPEARKFIEKEMEKFLFGDGGDLPAGYQPEPKSK